jgi:archaellum component FlaF (FlaF/FlaG flagellin family)
MSHVFIAHVEEDADVALEIALGLEEAGYRTWCYEVNSIPGTSYIVRTGEAVEQSQAVVVVISPNSLGSAQVTKEVVRGHEGGKHFVPVLRDITHAEFQKRQPEWREAIGSATSIRIPGEGVATIVPLVIDGLRALKIHPVSKLDSKRIDLIHRTMGELRSRVISGKGVEPVRPAKPVAEAKGRRKTKPLLIALGSLAVVAIIAVVAIFLSGGFGKKEVVLSNPTPTPAVTQAYPTPTPIPKPTATATVTPITSSPTPTRTPAPTSSPATLPTTGPDLIIQDITWSPEVPIKGKDVTFAVVVTNQGKADAKSFYVYYYVDGSYKDSDSVYLIDAGATTTVSFTWSAETGTHTVKAIADYTDLVAESNESNNALEITFSGTVIPDLIIQDITWSPTNPSSGQAVTFTVTVKNQGTGACGATNTHCCINGITYTGSYDTGSLYPGQVATAVFTWHLSAGTKIVLAQADYYGDCAESDESNNAKEVTLIIP